jgi:hypothetical protein
MTIEGESLATSESVLSLTADGRPISGATELETLGAETGRLDVLGVLFDPTATGWTADVTGYADRIDRFGVVSGHDDVSPAVSALPDSLRRSVRTVHAEQPLSLGEIGISVSDRLNEAGDARNSRLVFVDSFERVLADTPLRTAFRFLHILSESTAYTDAALYVSLDPGACDLRAAETVAELFDSVVSERR